jgi:hypothetical protein
VSPRPYWKGYLKLSLVSCPIAVHAACSSSERISFRQINRKTGNRLRQQLIDEETREAVVGSEKARGYEPARAMFRCSANPGEPSPAFSARSALFVCECLVVWQEPRAGMSGLARTAASARAVFSV